jgi:hypothetical protein
MLCSPFKKKQYPGVEIVNATVAGGGGSAARPALHTRLVGGNPPDTWQIHPGWELLGDYVEPGSARRQAFSAPHAPHPWQQHRLMIHVSWYPLHLRRGELSLREAGDRESVLRRLGFL